MVEEVEKQTQLGSLSRSCKRVGGEQKPAASVWTEMTRCSHTERRAARAPLNQVRLELASGSGQLLQYVDIR